MSLFLKILNSICELIRKIMHRIIFMPMKKANLLSCGKNVFIGYHATLPYRQVSIGDNVSIGANAYFMSVNAKIKIGNNVMFGPNTTIITGDHRVDVVGEYMINVKEKLPEHDQDVIIEDDVWIGANVTILKGVKIERGSIVAAGSVVNKNIPSYCMYGGIPARKIKDRFNTEQIKEHESKLY